MGAAAVPLMIFSTVLQAKGAIDEGKAADRLGKFKAEQLKQKAGQERATSQVKAENIRRQARIAESKALALAAASGGSASDPTVINIIAGIAGEGELAAQTSLYEGEERARGSELAAKTSLYEGSSAKRAGYTKAIGTIVSAAASASMAAKYSPNVPGDAYQPSRFAGY